MLHGDSIEPNKDTSAGEKRLVNLSDKRGHGATLFHRADAQGMRDIPHF
jgi:hypothetical protein